MRVDAAFLSLVKRSPDIGNGWRQCSSAVWGMVLRYEPSELIELDNENRWLRITPAGEAVVRFISKGGV